jgi:DNA-binding CsgD family transcriptional regulator
MFTDESLRVAGGGQPGTAPSSCPSARDRSCLAALAKPVLDSAADELVGTRVGLLLSDEEGWIVDHRVNDHALRSALNRVGLSPGHVWAGRFVGTNALERMFVRTEPVTVPGPEHLASVLAGLSGAAAPFTDPRTGRLLGAVGVVCPVEDANPLLVPYACRVAIALEGQLVGDASAAERALLERFVRIRLHTRVPLVSIGPRRMFLNAAAARYVEAVDHAVLWDCAERAISGRPRRAEAIRLSRGTQVAAECEPILFGAEPIGALVRLAVHAPDTDRTGAEVHRRSPRIGWASLTAAQLGVAELVATGLTNRAVASRLYVSPHTVDFHLRQIFNKLGIRSRVDLARIVAQQRHELQPAA